MPRQHRDSSLGEELASGVLHAVGATLSAAGLAVMLVQATHADPLRITSAVVFGLALLLLYSASTLYHLARRPRLKHALKILDHASIYVLIAGTYTPFALITLRGATGWWLFAVIWTLALAGVVAEAAWVHRPKWLSAAVYLTLGWMVVVAAEPLFRQLPRGGLALLFGGGVIYSLGTIFYVLQRVPYMHSVWHVFVLGGSVCHFLAVSLYVLPVQG
jgi:hemolysin III